MFSHQDQSAASGHTRRTLSMGGWRTFASIVVGVLVLALLPVALSMYWVHVLILCYLYVVTALSLRTIFISGQISLAHGAFMGIGAYVSAMLSLSLKITPWVSIPLAAIFTAIIGIVICFPFARLRALYYAMGTMFFGVAVVQVLNAGGAVTGGYSGLTQIPSLFNGDKIIWYYVALGFMVFFAAALYRFEFSRIGVDLKAIDQSPLVAQSVGINEFLYRILAVGVGCFVVGFAGALYAHYNGMISTTSFNFMATMWIMMYVLVGGARHFLGPIVGTFLLFLLPESMRQIGSYSPLIAAALLLIVVYACPGGFVAAPRAIAEAIRRRGTSARRRGGREV
jgi:branched-chain amino acid transport system permease protein